MKKREKKAVITKNHKTDDCKPLIVNKGDRVEGQEKKTEWEGWLWCRTADGVTGWIPKNYLRKDLDKTGYYSALRDYNARELTAHIGQSIIILDEQSGWALVKTNSQETGWIPIRNLSFRTENE
jgi:uncharacterized protein YgiM (DUF1202 family)